MSDLPAHDLSRVSEDADIWEPVLLTHPDDPYTKNDADGTHFQMRTVTRSLILACDYCGIPDLNSNYMIYEAAWRIMQCQAVGTHFMTVPVDPDGDETVGLHLDAIDVASHAGLVLPETTFLTEPEWARRIGETAHRKIKRALEKRHRRTG